jgi:hypothetical protein
MPYLFHYTSADSAFKILDSCTLHAGRIAGSNDPFEDVELDFYEECYDKETIRSINEDLKSYLHSVVRFISFSNGSFVRTNRKERILEEADDLENKRRPGYFYPRMWGQYGDHHRGVCLVFDQARLSKAIRKRLSADYDVNEGDVRYINITRSTYTDRLFGIYEVDHELLKQLRPQRYIQRLLSRHSRFLYYRKDSDWRNEKEYRFLIVNKYENKTTDDLFVYFDRSLVAIVLGIRFNNNEDRFRDFAEDYRVPLLVLEKSAGTVFVQ